MKKIIFDNKKIGILSMPFVMAFLAHLMAITNRIFSADDYWNLVRSWKDGVALGRVLRPIFEMTSSSKYNINAISGVVAIFFLATTVDLIIEIFDVDKNIIKGLIAAVIIMSPCAFSTLTFPVASAANFIALFFAFLALYLLEKKPTENVILSKVLPVFLIVMSMMVYQVYATTIIVAFLTKRLIEYLQENKAIITKNNVINLCFMLGSIVCYVILYKLIFIIFKIQPADYQGFSKAGPRMNLKSLISALEKSIHGFTDFWIGSQFGFYSVVNIIFGILLVGLVVKNVFSSCNKFKTLLWSIAVLLAMSEACFMLYLTSSKMYYHNLMTWGCCFFYVLCVILAEKENWPVMSCLALSIVAIICFYNYQNGNIGYHQLDVSREKTDYVVQNMIREIDSISDGTQKIAIVGDMKNFDTERCFETNPVITGADEEIKIFSPYGFAKYSRVYFGRNYELVDDNQLDKISDIVLSDKETYKDVYPYGNYCFKYGDYIVVNFGEFKE